MFTTHDRVVDDEADSELEREHVSVLIEKPTPASRNAPTSDTGIVPSGTTSRASRRKRTDHRDQHTASQIAENTDSIDRSMNTVGRSRCPSSLPSAFGLEHHII